MNGVTGGCSRVGLGWGCSWDEEEHPHPHRRGRRIGGKALGLRGFWPLPPNQGSGATSLPGRGVHQEPS